MKRIIKSGDGPALFTEWLQGGSGGMTPEWEAQLATGDWRLLPNPEKQMVHEELLAEQGSLCCYCQSRIVRRMQPGATVDDGSHIEHLLPRKHFPHLTFAYKNLVASCQEGSDSTPRVPERCGSAKDAWPTSDEQHLFLSPLDPECEKHFEYRLDGRIVAVEGSEHATAAAETIRQLRLDLPRLVARRRAEIEVVLDGLQPQEAPLLLASYQSRDSQGRFRPFAGVVVHVLGALTAPLPSK